MPRLPALASLLAALALAGCGGEPTNRCLHGGDGCATLSASLAALNAGRPATRRVQAAIDPASLPAWQAGSILSGPPDELRVRVRRVSTWGTVDGKTGQLSLFEAADPAGVELSLTSGTVDLASALGVPLLALPPGHYQGLDLEVARVGRISGCVAGTFRPTSPVTGPMSEQLLGWAPGHAGNTYSNDPITDLQVHAFCTSAARSEVSVPTYSTDAIGSNADFEAVGVPELTEVDLAASNPDGLSPGALAAASLTVHTDVAFDVTADGANALTLGVDLNRMLRYFANTREDLSPPNPEMKAGTSYFFTTTFGWSTVLVASPEVAFEGYQTQIVQHRTGGGDELVPGWLTVARVGGAVVSGLVIPDDDDDLTVAKGNLEPSACVETTPGTWTLGFVLGPPGQQTRGSFDGFVFGAVGEVTTAGLTPLPGAWSEGATYDVVATRRL